MNQIISKKAREKYNRLMDAYDKIIVCFDRKKQEIERIIDTAADMDVKSLLIIADETCDSPDHAGPDVRFYRMGAAEKEEFMDLCRTYEFSDHIIMLTENTQYPSLSNYLLSHFITEEDAYRALLW